ncbi:hypothetical protein [uncultured Acetobacteroides sp.]|uniref:hypothetical protein n=1 Tax=uncultured Acetobacteroides sp. TaxID=1760811 RepID=UPI0029F5C8AD|nr:hypothetical protein [uncultured Acetobacteroides sp.]
MAKNKKKKSGAQQPKFTAKDIIQNQENEYRKGLTEFLQRIDLLEPFNRLPPITINTLIKVRISSVRIEPIGKDKLNKEDSEYVKSYLSHILQMEHKTRYPNGAALTNKEFAIYLMTLHLHISSYLEKSNDEEARKAFSEMISYIEEQRDSVFGTLQYHINFSSSWMSNPIDGYVEYESVDFDVKDDDKRTVYDSWCSPVIFRYKTIAPRKQHVVIDGKKREVFEMAYASFEGELRWCAIPPKLLKKEGEAPVRLFIQKHALNRMNERLDYILNEMQYFFSAKSVVETTKVKHIGDDRYLIPVVFYGRKLGYLVANYVDSILVVTTFLFITQEGTPEGMLLNKLTGFKKLDKKYLCIDKLSTFINSDIASKPELVKLLEDANLGHLVDLYEEIKCVCLDQEENLHDPSFIMEYIQKKQEEEQLSLTEQQEQKEAEEEMLTPIPNLVEELPMLLPLASKQAQVTGQQLV